MPIMRLQAKSIEEVLALSKEVSRYYSNHGNEILWYRGQGQHDWGLIPSALRLKKGEYNAEYSILEESYLYQHFSARAYHKLNVLPSNIMEWQEIMQHHFVRTRLLDFSENVHIGLLFALEAYMSDDSTFRDRRLQNTPALWLINPSKVNQVLFKKLAEKDNIKLLTKQKVNSGGKIFPRSLSLLLEKLIREHNSINTDSKNGIGAITSLSKLNDMRMLYGAHFLNAVRSKEFNPFFYLILRAYSDNIILNKPLPPLPVIHPYHSSRIEKQKGTFLVFPFTKDEPVPLDKNEDCSDAICQIYLTDPERIASSLKRMGYTRVDIYPDLDNYGKDLAKH